MVQSSKTSKFAQKHKNFIRMKQKVTQQKGGGATTFIIT
jgi:hypothetical protein